MKRRGINIACDQADELEGIVKKFGFVGDADDAAKEVDEERLVL